jgi:hypothetical protein
MPPQLPAKSAYALMAGFVLEKQRCKTGIVSPLSAAELLRIQYDNEWGGFTELVDANSISLNCLKPTTIRRETIKTRPLTKKPPECIIIATRISHTMSEVATITISLTPELLRATNCRHISERKVKQREKAKQSPRGR